MHRLSACIVTASHAARAALKACGRTGGPPASPLLPLAPRGPAAARKKRVYCAQLRAAHLLSALKETGVFMLPIIIGIVLVVAIISAVAGIYNNMVTLRNRIDNAWQNIDTQLQRRNDLIPNLVETVKGYAAHEKETLDAVTSARNAAVSASTPDEKIAADNVLTGALRQLLAVAEAYPDLKANTNFSQLQSTLEDTENKISYARQSYNDCVLKYNNAIQTFPGNIFAGIFQFKERSGFEAAPETRDVPQVKF